LLKNLFYRIILNVSIFFSLPLCYRLNNIGFSAMIKYADHACSLSPLVGIFVRRNPQRRTLLSRGEIWIFSREARNARESIRAAYAYATYHVVIIDAGRCRQERVRVLPRRITDADERSLITLAVRILSLALDAPVRLARSALCAYLVGNK